MTQNSMMSQDIKILKGKKQGGNHHGGNHHGYAQHAGDHKSKRGPEVINANYGHMQHHNESQEVAQRQHFVADQNVDIMNHRTKQEPMVGQQARQAKGTKSKLKGNAAVSQGSVTSEKSIGFTNHKNSLLDESISANSVVNMQQQLQKMNTNVVTGKRSGGSRTHAEGTI